MSFGFGIGFRTPYRFVLRGLVLLHLLLVGFGFSGSPGFPAFSVPVFGVGFFGFLWGCAFTFGFFV